MTAAPYYNIINTFLYKHKLKYRKEQDVLDSTETHSRLKMMKQSLKPSKKMLGTLMEILPKQS